MKHLLILAAIIPTLLHAQKQGNIWHFGAGAGLSFNTTPPIFVSGGQTYYPSPNEWNEGTSSMCDSSGTLLFYSNGAKVWDRSHQIMPNGHDIMGHPSSTHSSLIIPKPGSDREYYVFTTDASENNFANGLRYSIVDICLEEGMGDVLSTQKNVLLRPNVAEKLAAVRHQNGIDYWVISHENENNNFLIYLLDASGLTENIVPLGPNSTIGWGGQLAFSPDGTMLAYSQTTTFGYLALYDFDCGTGSLSNLRYWDGDIPRMFWGLAFSPDNSKLYFTTANAGSVRQLDLLAGSWAQVQTSEAILGTIIPDKWKDIRLGPDGKIYVSHATSSMIGVINAPNEIGILCDFQDLSIPVGGVCSFGLPSFVANYSYSNSLHFCSHNSVDQTNIPIGLLTLEGRTLQFTDKRKFKQIRAIDLLGHLRFEMIDPFAGRINVELPITGFMVISALDELDQHHLLKALVE